MLGLVPALSFPCPRCGSARLRRSVAQDGWERFVRAVAGFHYYRCRDCGHRGSRFGRVAFHHDRPGTPTVPARPVEERDVVAAATRRRQMVLLVLIALASGVATGALIDSCQPAAVVVES